MEGDPFVLIEGMTIAGLAVGADHGYIYLRAEYPHAQRTLQAAIASAETRGYLGDNLLGSGKAFHLEVRMAAGAYICGEETSLLESLEGRRGQVRFKPPLPAIAGSVRQAHGDQQRSHPRLGADHPRQGCGLLSRLRHGQDRAARCRLQLAGNIKRAGLVERAFGLTLRELVEDYGGGTRQRPADPRGPGRRSAGRLYSRFPTRHGDRLRGVCRHWRHAWPRRHRGVRRQCRHGRAGALCDGILRDRILRQMHAVPDRIGARRRGDRPHGGRYQDRSREGRGVAARPVPDHAGRVAVRAGRHGTVPGAQRA